MPYGKIMPLLSGSAIIHCHDQTVEHPAKEGVTMSNLQSSPNPPQITSRRGRPSKRDTVPTAQQSGGAACSTSAEPPRDETHLKRLLELVHLVRLASTWPNRPVDARWQIASMIVNGIASRRAFRRVYDEEIAHAVKYLKSLKACQTDADRDRLRQKMPRLHQAHFIHESPDKLLRGILEGRLLAGQSIEETAMACNLPLETVRLYEALFFAVVGINRRHTLMTLAIGEKCWHGLLEEDVDVILKRFGLECGLTMLEEAIRYYASPWRIPERLGTLTKTELVELKTMISVKALIQAWVLPFEKFHRVLKLQALRQELQVLIDASPNLDADAQVPVRVDLTTPSAQISCERQAPVVENMPETASEPATTAA
jgi:hypothetical protein